MKKIFSVILVVCLLICGCSKDTSKGTIEKISYEETNEITNYVKLETTKGIILVELYPDVAPITIKDFMIQGGDPEGTGLGGSSKTIKGEFKNNGVNNDLSHTRGVISMARNSISMDSASSQFFIVQKDSTYLDGDYAAFGKVIAGMDVVDKIANVNVDSNDKPTSTQKIKSIRFIKIGE